MPPLTYTSSAIYRRNHTKMMHSEGCALIQRDSISVHPGSRGRMHACMHACMGVAAAQACRHAGGAVLCPNVLRRACTSSPSTQQFSSLAQRPMVESHPMRLKVIHACSLI